MLFFIQIRQLYNSNFCILFYGKLLVDIPGQTEHLIPVESVQVIPVESEQFFDDDF